LALAGLVQPTSQGAGTCSHRGILVTYPYDD
jgi:hypothetical protein